MWATVDEVAWHRRTRWPLLAASFVYLVAYSWRVIGDLQGVAWSVTTWILAVTWAMFVIDYIVRLSLAENRGSWFRHHLGALAFALVPVLRLVQLLRVLTRVPALHGTAGAALRTKIIIYSGGVSVVLVYIASLAVLEAERDAPSATIVSFGDALWWSCVTVTTTGFGDFVPVTGSGRLIGVGLMMGGVALAGIITATLASWIVERASRNDDSAEPATRGQVRALMAKVDALARPPAATGADPVGADPVDADPSP